MKKEIKFDLTWLSEKEQKVFEWVQELFADDPDAISHAYRVAYLSYSYYKDYSSSPTTIVPKALLHDVVEDVPDMTFVTVKGKLRDIGYNEEDQTETIKGLVDLTKKYTKEKYPDLNREERLLLELNHIKSYAKDSKYNKICDVFDNTGRMISKGFEFASTYIYEQEKKYEVLGIDLVDPTNFYGRLGNLIKGQYAYLGAFKKS